MSNPSPLSSLLPTARLRVGECTVDMPLREIHAPGARRPRRVTPKAIGVLAVLIEQGGRVVSREALMAQVWAGTLPTDDVVTQAITQLRKAFDDERGNPRYIETIAKFGYRLLAPVEWLDQPAAPDSADGSVAEPGVAAPEATRPRYAPAPLEVRGDWRAVVAAMTVAAVVFAVVLLWSLRRDAPGAMATRHAQAFGRNAVSAVGYRLITSVPGIESSPSLSPDGALVAYVAVPAAGQRRTAIMVQTTDPSTPRQLSHPEEAAADSAPAWSPNGREIAFLRVVPGRDCKVMVLPSSGGTERSVGECDPRNPPSFDWTYDGRGLVFGSRGTPTGGAGLRLLDLASGEWRLLDYGAIASDVDFAPHYSPDGRWIVFVRNSPVGDLFRLPSTGGRAQRLSRLHADIRGWDWMPDGRSVVLSRWSASASRLLQLDLDSGVLRDMGIQDAIEPSVAAKVPALAFSESRSYFGVHRMALSGRHEMDRLFPSSGRDRLPVIAPDDRQLVFTSDRSGDFGLWWVDLKRPESLRLVEGVRPESWHRPDWSRDSRRLLVVGDGAAGVGLYEVTPASGQVVRLRSPAADVVQAVYLPDDDARLLVVAGGEEGRLQLRLYDRRTRPWQSLAMIPDVAVVRVDAANRRVLFTRPGRSGLWQADLALSPGSVRQIDAEVPEVGRYRAWTVAADGRIYYFEPTPDCASALRRVGDARSLLCVDRNRRNGPSGFSLAPRSDAIYVTLSLWDGGDIGFTSLAVPSEPIGSQ